MLELLQAERIKLARLKAAWFLVWIWPIGIVLAAVLATGWELVRPEPGPNQLETAAQWIRETLFVWRGPISTPGRYALVAFTAIAFAGEYGWNTWKLIAPHRNRTALLAAKFVTVFVMTWLAYFLLGVLVVITMLANAAITGDPIPSGITLSALLEGHSRAVLVVLPVSLLTIAYGAAAAILARSTVGGIIAGIVLVTVEPLTKLLLIHRPEVYHWSPAHHLANLQSWIENGRALRIPITDPPIADARGVSLAYLAILIVGLVAVTIAAFRRQDLN